MINKHLSKTPQILFDLSSQTGYILTLHIYCKDSETPNDYYSSTEESDTNEENLVEE